MRCRRCGFNNEDSYKFCGKCGFELSRPYLLQKRNIIICSCGSEIEASNTKCPKCGADLSNPIKSKLPNSILSIIAAGGFAISMACSIYLNLDGVSFVLAPISLVLLIISKIVYKDDLADKLLMILLILLGAFFVVSVVYAYLFMSFLEGLCTL